MAQSEDKSFLLQIADNVQSIASTPSLNEILQKEKTWGFDKRTLTATVDDKEMDLMLHWTSEDKEGFFCSFRQPLFPSVTPKMAQVAFSYPRTVSSTNLDECPAEIELKLSITPLVACLDSVQVQTTRQGADYKSLTWIDKTQHVLRGVTETQTVVFKALAHDMGVYELNQFSIEVKVGQE